VRKLVLWRTSDTAAAPFGDELDATQSGRRERNHARTFLQNAPVETIENIVGALNDAAVGRIEKVVADEAVKRTVYADRPKPTFKDAQRKAAVKKAGRLKAKPDEAASEFIASLGRGRAQIRVICQGYQDFLALVQDEEWREYARELLVSFQANVNLALGEVLEGSLDDALARLLAEEEVK
jgi:hypothetical protein